MPNLPADRQDSLVNNLCERIEETLNATSFRRVWTLEKYQEWKKNHIFGADGYNRLPRYAITQIRGFEDAWLRVRDKHRLVWTHMLDGVRMTANDPRLVGKSFVVHENSNRSCFAYAVRLEDADGNKRVVFVPFRESHRQLDLADGVLSQVDLDAIEQYKSVDGPPFVTMMVMTVNYRTRELALAPAFPQIEEKL